MIQLGKFVGGVGGGWLTPTTYIQLAGAGSIITFVMPICNLQESVCLQCRHTLASLDSKVWALLHTLQCGGQARDHPAGLVLHRQDGWGQL